MQYINPLYKSSFFSLPAEEKKKIYFLTCFVFIFSFLAFGDQALNTFVKHDDWTFLDGTYGSLLPKEGRFICFFWSLLSPYFPSLFTLITTELMLWSFSIVIFCYYLLKPFHYSYSIVVFSFILVCSPQFRDILEWPHGSFIFTIAFFVNTICSTFLYSKYKWIAFIFASTFSLLVTQPLWFIFSLQVISYIVFDFVFGEEQKQYKTLFKELFLALITLAFSLVIAIVAQKLLLYIAFHTTSLKLQSWRNPNPISNLQDIITNITRAGNASMHLLLNLSSRIGISLSAFLATLGVFLFSNIFFGKQGHLSGRIFNAVLLFTTCAAFFFSLSFVTVLTGIDLPFRSQAASWVSFCVISIFLTINLRKPLGNILLSVLLVFALLTANQNSILFQKRARQIDMDISTIRHVEQDLFAMDAYNKGKKIVFWGSPNYKISQSHWMKLYRSYYHLVADHTVFNNISICISNHCDWKAPPQEYKNTASQTHAIYPERGYISEERDFILVKMGK